MDKSKILDGLRSTSKGKLRYSRSSDNVVDWQSMITVSPFDIFPSITLLFVLIIGMCVSDILAFPRIRLHAFQTEVPLYPD
mgnify:FL=1